MQDLPSKLVKNEENLSKVIELMNSDSDIENYVQQNKTGKDIPDLYEFEAYQEGNVQPKQKKKIKIETKPPTSPSAPRKETKHSNPSFGINVDSLMQKQKATNPTLEIPIVLNSLIEAFFKMDNKIEGIFRVPANATEVKEVKDKIDQGFTDSGMIVSFCSNVHTICALLKLWLRELPDPIIPNSVYNNATENVEKANDVFQNLPPYNKTVITIVIQLIKELSKQDLVQTTKMDVDNLSMVFAPSFLRCPFSEYTAAISAAEKEKLFVVALTNIIPPKDFSSYKKTEQ